MTQGDKNLVLTDLCGRLPYDIKIKDEYGDCINVNIYNADIEHLIDRVVSGLDKMVLRPMSSMTEEEKNEHYNRTMTSDIVRTSKEVIDYLNKKMFDYRGLIEKGLAIAVTEDNNLYKI